MSDSNQVEIFGMLIKAVKELISAENALVDSIMKDRTETVFTDIAAELEMAVVSLTDADENDEDGFDSETLFRELELDEYSVEYIINKWKNHLK